MMPILACLTSFLLAWAYLGSANFGVRKSAAQAPQHHTAQLVARHQPKPAAPLLTHPRHKAGR